MNDLWHSDPLLGMYHKWKIGFESLKRGLMINWSNLTFLFFGALGTFILLLLQWIISWRLPKYPAQAIESLRNVQRTTAEGEFQGDADIYNLDRSLMEAELEHPGSTLRIYYNQPASILSRLIGSILVSFTLTGWVLRTFQFNCMSVLALLFGIGFLLYPYLTWNMSRPTLKKR